jgi:hypothetical protein
MERINFRDRIVGNVKQNTLCPLYMASLNFSVYYDLWTSKRLSILCGVVACGKCNVISVTRSKKPIKFDHTLHGHTLYHGTKAKYLGVTIISDLKWGSHINNITKKANIPSAF